ncbi:diguanylate cyclase domain-containing protein [Actinoplanes sp. GCM10030250]|uniref:diguanylate cyclase domain-containing protein n=1 Tax=Actinoplanes sp. GCM10030250 TaxID=3273376 RepID=UPI00361C1547
MARTLLFTALYLVATYAGRLTVMDQTNLSLVWPAAGVSAVWFLLQYTSPWRALDVVALTAVTVAVNMVTGTPALLAGWFVVANVAQAWMFAHLFRRWMPQLWGAGGDQPLGRINELWHLVAAAFLSTAGGALIGPTGVWAVSGTYSWQATAVWLTRNTVSILLIGVAGIRIGHLLSLRPTGRLWRAPSDGRAFEYVAVVVLSAAAYTAVFRLNESLPLAFTVIGMTIWAGSRLHTVFVVVHDLVFGSVAVLFTLNGNGVFAQIHSHAARALVAQVFVGMIAVVGLALALGRDERINLFRELRAAQQATARQNAMMGAIVDSMSEGLTVIDEQGRFLLRNPAVRDLLGGVVSSTDRMAQPDHYGLLHPDGSPLLPGEMPYRQAFAGTDVRNMDVLVRNPGLPEGRILSVSSTLLPAGLDGPRCAVTVFHDVTAERRHRDELAAFAGVVAHDLLNPLATIQGWTESLTETFEGGSSHPDAADAAAGLVRIRRAATRMNDLINDLLAYTTARDAAVHPTMIDLNETAGDIAIARIDQAQSAGKPVPVFHIGDLQPVHADPVLVRQLLDNLVSNAVKYTAAGVVPELRISTEPAGGLVSVIIDDNGIGIPPGQQSGIFDNFHRAHPGAGYTGTGLGLGICKRIVERHGGSITATANPNGTGSRFTFTLPADATAVLSVVEQPSPSPSPSPPPLPPSPPSQVPLPPAAAFEYTAQLVLNHLHEQIPLAFWAVTRVENGRQTYLYLDADNGYGLRQGESHAWEDSFCVHMAAGNAPAVAGDAQAVPVYAAAAINTVIPIGTYAGAAITEPDGSLFGAICGLDPQAHAGDPRVADAEPLLVLLGRVLTTALAADRAQDRFTNALLMEQLNADTDELTGLPNRRGWQRAVDRAQAAYQRLADPTVMAVLDLDGLKAVNDTLGRAAGDAYLCAAADAVRGALRDSDIVARLGGDEFGLLLTDCDQVDAEAIIARLHAHLDAAGVSASVGWVCADPQHGVIGALAEADARMYRVKEQRHAGASPGSFNH